jgi:uncharacterized protein YndB with AHSA1/START domain
MAETVTLHRDYPHPPERLFAAWTDVELVRQWFGCGPGMLWTVHEWDVRPGGAIRVSLTFDTDQAARHRPGLSGPVRRPRCPARPDDGRAPPGPRGAARPVRHR